MANVGKYTIGPMDVGFSRAQRFVTFFVFLEGVNVEVQETHIYVFFGNLIFGADTS